MKTTISLHSQGDAMVVTHNRRDPVTLKEAHIDHDGIHETWIDRDIREFYQETFDDSVKDWNARQKNVDRRIDDYYAEVRKDHKQHLVYETIIQVGNRDVQPEEPVCREILHDYVEHWQKDNPTMELIGAYYHADEPDGTPHLHLDYVPVARDCTRGMRVQNSHNKAIQQLGITQGHFKNLAHAFQEKERDYLEHICREHGLDVERGVCEKGRQHLDTELYKAQQALSKTIDDINDLDKHKTVLERDIERETAKRERMGKTWTGRKKDRIEVNREEFERVMGYCNDADEREAKAEAQERANAAKEQELAAKEANYQNRLKQLQNDQIALEEEKVRYAKEYARKQVIQYQQTIEKLQRENESLQHERDETNKVLEYTFFYRKDEYLNKEYTVHVNGREILDSINKNFSRTHSIDQAVKDTLNEKVMDKRQELDEELALEQARSREHGFDR